MNAGSSTADIIPPKHFAWLVFAFISAILTMLGVKTLSQTQPYSDSRKSAQPNVLMIVADDLGYNDVSSLNKTGIHTPAIDQLADNGVLFTRFYADAICAPSRVGLLTGREPERSGFRPGGMGIPDEFTTLPEHLGNQGYVTKLVGKWHAGTAHRRSWPDQHGFQQWYGFLDQWQLQLPANSQRSGAKPSYKNPWLQRDSQPPEQRSGHLSDILLEESLSFIRQHQSQSKPWFLYHAFLAPHHPIEPAPRFASQFPDTPQGQYRALVSQLDYSVGELMNALNESGDLANTVVIFLSDNGGTNKQLDNNFPFKGRKAEVFEGSYRTPLIIHWPDQLQTQRQAGIVHNTDIYPSLVTALGLVGINGLDGRDLWSHWRTTNAHENRQQISPQHARFWETYYPGLDLMTFSALSADGRWRLSHDLNRNTSLYDLATDPSGYTDVAASYPEIVTTMSHQYLAASTRYSEVPLNDTKRGPRQIMGFDQMRIADEHQQTIVFELFSPSNTDFPEELLRQADTWLLATTDSRRIHLKVGDSQISSEAPLTPSCAVIGITVGHTRAAFIGPKDDQTVFKLYQDGVLQDTLEQHSAPRRHAWPATAITSSRVGQLKIFNKLAVGPGELTLVPLTASQKDKGDAAPWIFPYPTIKDLSQGLCRGETL